MKLMLYTRTGVPRINYRLMMRCFNEHPERFITRKWSHENGCFDNPDVRYVKPIRQWYQKNQKPLFTFEPVDPSDISPRFIMQDIGLSSSAMAKVDALVLLLDDSYEEKEKG